MGGNMKRMAMSLVVLFAFALVCNAALAKEESSGRTLRVAVYKVTTNGFSLNGSEVTEMNRLALQACFDAGLKCSGRDETVGNVGKEQGYGGKGKIAQADYVAEFTLTGSTPDGLKLGLPGGINIGAGMGKNIGGIYVGGGGYTDLSGLGIKMGRMSLTGQISDASDGTLAYSKTEEKLGLQGSFLIGEATSSNAKKLLSTFRKMFEDFKEKNQ